MVKIVKLIDCEKENISSVDLIAALITYAAYERSKKPGFFVFEPPSRDISTDLAQNALKIACGISRGKIISVDGIPLNLMVRGNLIDVTGYEEQYGWRSANKALSAARNMCKRLATGQWILPHDRVLPPPVLRRVIAQPGYAVDSTDYNM